MIPSIVLEAQFLGGNGDGYKSAYLAVPINQQNLYCSGGDSDGYNSGSSSSVELFEQDFYCSGGAGDGYSKDAVITPNNSQEFYCQGGNGDGHSFGDTIPIIFIGQEFYCSGGDGDGYNSNLLLSPVNQQDFYCQGGNTDGYDSDASTPIIFIDQDFYCSGGDGDGYSKGLILTSPNQQDFYCQGGNSDGYDAYGSSPTILFNQDFYCSGGNNDGYTLGSILGSMNQQEYYCSGGASDGYAMLSSGIANIFDASFYCSGGIGDGHSFGFYSGLPLGSGVWTGLVNTTWNYAGNWMHNVVPDINTGVTIPDNCPRYPILTLALGVNTTSGIYKCQSFDLSDGASLTINNYMYVSGDATISGDLYVTYNRNYLVQINNNGNLTINPTGYMHLGAPSGGRSLADLQVQDGGVLNISGGILHIDDQLTVFEGGELSMTSGELFAGQYGYGSPLAGYAPAVLRIRPGALGGISGGDLKVCGHYSVDYPGGVVLGEPGFHITDSATLIFMNGDLGTHYNTAMWVTNGARIQNLIINKPGNTVFLRSNLHIIEDLIIEAGATFEAETGHTITIGP